MKDLIYNKDPGTNDKAPVHVNKIFKHVTKGIIQKANLTESYTRNLHRRRTANGPQIERLPRPASLAKWVIPERLRYFVLHDSAVTLGDHRFVLLGTEEELRILAGCKYIYSDGTFKVPEFYQVKNYLTMSLALHSLLFAALACKIKVTKIPEKLATFFFSPIYS